MAKNPRLEIEAGMRYGRLTVVSCAPSRNKHRYINCICDCGVRKVVRLDGLTRGTSRSCGCLQKEKAAELGHGNVIHAEGYDQTVEYYTWKAMKERCFNENNKEYRNYGGRGITVCKQWQGSFEKFLAHVRRRPTNKHSLDRIDNEGNYEPGNVKWSLPKEQARNMRSNRMITYNGETKCLTDWANQLGLDVRVLWNRLNRGWSLERALTRISR